jgi:hypothetical protein
MRVGRLVRNRNEVKELDRSQRGEKISTNAGADPAGKGGRGRRKGENQNCDRRESRGQNKGTDNSGCRVDFASSQVRHWSVSASSHGSLYYSLCLCWVQGWVLGGQLIDGSWDGTLQMCHPPSAQKQTSDKGHNQHRSGINGSGRAQLIGRAGLGIPIVPTRFGTMSSTVPRSPDADTKKKKGSKYCPSSIKSSVHHPIFDIHLEARGVYEGRRLTTREKCFCRKKLELEAAIVFGPGGTNQPSPLRAHHDVTPPQHT